MPVRMIHTVSRAEPYVFQPAVMAALAVLAVALLLREGRWLEGRALMKKRPWQNWFLVAEATVDAAFFLVAFGIFLLGGTLIGWEGMPSQLISEALGLLLGGLAIKGALLYCLLRTRRAGLVFALLSGPIALPWLLALVKRQQPGQGDRPAEEGEDQARAPGTQQAVEQRTLDRQPAEQQAQRLADKLGGHALPADERAAQKENAERHQEEGCVNRGLRHQKPILPGALLHERAPLQPATLAQQKRDRQHRQRGHDRGLKDVGLRARNGVNHSYRHAYPPLRKEKPSLCGEGFSLCTLLSLIRA